MKFAVTVPRPRVVSRLTAAVMLALWLETIALTISPSLHGLLHSDAKGPQHHCVVTQVQKQALLGPTTPVVVMAVPRVVFRPPAIGKTQSPAECDYRISPSRAPPLLIVSSPVAG